MAKLVTTTELRNLDFTFENIGLITGLSFSVSLRYNKMKYRLFGFNPRKLSQLEYYLELRMNDLKKKKDFSKSLKCSVYSLSWIGFNGGAVRMWKTEANIMGNVEFRA